MPLLLSPSESWVNHKIIELVSFFFFFSHHSDTSEWKAGFLVWMIVFHLAININAYHFEGFSILALLAFRTTLFFIRGAI